MFRSAKKFSVVSILDGIPVFSILCGGVLKKHLLSPAISNMPVYIQHLPVKSHSCLCSSLPTTHLTPSGHQILPPSQPLTPTTQVDLAQTYLASRTWEQHVPSPSGLSVWANRRAQFDFDLISLVFTWFNWQHRRAGVEAPPTITISSTISRISITISCATTSKDTMTITITFTNSTIVLLLVLQIIRLAEPPTAEIWSLSGHSCGGKTLKM